MRPGSPEWNRLVTASKVSAILGLSPWDSPLTTWLRMRGQLPSDDGSNAEAKARGHYLEGGVLQWWKDRHEVAVGREQEFCTVPEIPWGAATPDLLTTDDFGNLCVVDAKTAATADDWGTPGTDEAPAYYAAQALWQLAMVPEAQVAYIAVLFGRPHLKFEEYVIPRDDALIASIVARCRDFWESLAADEPPPLSDHPAEYDAIRKVHTGIERGLTVELPADLAQDYLTAKAYEAHADSIKARVLDAMGLAQHATHNGQKVARRQPYGEAVSLVCAVPAKALALPKDKENAA